MGSVTYPGLPGLTISTYVSRQESAQRLGTGVSCHIGRIAMVANTGTYLDAPYHFHAQGVDVAQLALQRLVDVPIVMIRVRDRGMIGPEVLPDPGVLWGEALLVPPGGRGTGELRAYLSGSPYLTRGFARAVVEANVAVLGIDALNVDNVEDLDRPVRHTVLGHDIHLISPPSYAGLILVVIGLGLFIGSWAEQRAPSTSDYARLVCLEIGSSIQGSASLSLDNPRDGWHVAITRCTGVCSDVPGP